MKDVLKTNKNLAAAVGALRKEFGDDSIVLASEPDYSYRYRVPTGIYELDKMVGGGVPRGRVTMLTGAESACKTTICLLIVARLQHTCRECLREFLWYSALQDDGETYEFELITPCECGKNEPHTVAYIDAEGALDLEWAASLGVDVQTLLLMQPENHEQSSDTVNALIRTGELDGLFIDSIAQMTPSREVDTSASAGQRPDMALLTNKLMRTMTSSLSSLGISNRRKPVVMVVNQDRLQVGVSYGSPVTNPGGKGQLYAASIIISLSPAGYANHKGEHVKTGPKRDGPQYLGREFNFDIKKNKTAAPHRKGSFMLFNVSSEAHGVRKGTFDNLHRMVEDANLVGEVKGAWLDLTEIGIKNPERKDGRFQGKDSLRGFLGENPDAAALFVEAVANAI